MPNAAQHRPATGPTGRGHPAPRRCRGRGGGGGHVGHGAAVAAAEVHLGVIHLGGVSANDGRGVHVREKTTRAHVVSIVYGAHARERACCSSTRVSRWCGNRTPGSQACCARRIEQPWER